MNSYDVVIIGGGIVGASAAYHLTRLGAKTLLVDSRDAGRATDAGAGIITAETGGASIAPEWFTLALKAAEYYPTLISELEQAEAGDTGYAVCGELVVAIDEDELDAYEQKKNVIFARQKQRGAPSADELREISPEEACALFPALKPPLKALYFSGAARVDGRMLAAAMLKAAQSRDLNFESGRVEELIIENGRATGVRVQSRDIQAGKVIIAGGAWSAGFSEQLGCSIPVEPQRGQIIHLRLEGANTGDWPVVGAFRSHYMVCWPDGRVVAGATRETGSGFVPQTTAAGVREVLSEALRVAPGLGDATIGEVRVGLRPRTVDNLPVLGGVPNVDGVFLSTGHGATGLHLGPYSGKLAAEWAVGKAPEADISAFGITRFKA